MAKVLIVDDSAIMRRNLAAIMGRGGHEVIGEALNGMQALAEYGNLHPDIVTMDITMPLSDGIEALGKLLGRYPDARVVMISAINQKDRVFEAIKLGAKNYIIKPFEEDKVINIINQVLGLK
ncbi:MULTISPECIES: response regulator [Dehalobacter]|jgi:two-component system chemotaxis response regulator CheY|uniref:Stage 0 sporulation protein A homolog n=1 Tax=Dehalobacter restrictus (strain DSM 9455 / PER-K23) TaxID=871738 RepID=A0ABN4BUC6_DEHRP|nr:MULTISPECIES: response regulator [Dehalobacter]AHF11016.1 chemotaxis protein CheY [Dehalobacter restrictus DSM 9455]MCG1024732.1 response regulator [Dehalobacter sp.]MDJ0307038.1 response regulator [Dehalobacter sp.]OCZ49579.1 two-component system response regulator [Dehalobacter sp. TeCB1]RJE47508.1 two-component system response regulator [Dehalobacter sp. MCB1]